jgi:hypothetical protein
LTLWAHSDLAALGSWRRVLLLGAELASVELVGVFEAGEFARSCGEWSGPEVWVLQSVDCVDSLSPVESEKVAEEGYSRRSLSMMER